MCDRRSSDPPALIIIYDPPSMSSHHFFSLSPLLDALAPLDEEDKKELEKTEAMAARMRALTANSKGKGKALPANDTVMSDVIDCVSPGASNFCACL